MDPLLRPIARSTRSMTKRSLDLLTALATSSDDRTTVSSTCKITSPILRPASSAAEPNSISKTEAPCWLTGFHSLTDSSSGEDSGWKIKFHLYVVFFGVELCFPFFFWQLHYKAKRFSFTEDDCCRNWIPRDWCRRRIIRMSSTTLPSVSDEEALSHGLLSVVAGYKKLPLNAKQKTKLIVTWSNQNMPSAMVQ